MISALIMFYLMHKHERQIYKENNVSIFRFFYLKKLHFDLFNEHLNVTEVSGCTEELFGLSF